MLTATCYIKTQGQGYKDSGCKTYRFAVYGPGKALPSHFHPGPGLPLLPTASADPFTLQGTQCWKSGGNGRIESLNWFHSQSKRVVKPRSVNETEACSPHFFSYPDAEGKMVDIKVEDAAHAEYIAQLYEQKDLTALADLEKCK